MHATLRLSLVLIAAAGLAVSPARSGLLDKLLGKGAPSDEKVAAGLKEALDVGTANATASTGKIDGYFRNEAIKILVPEPVRKLDKGLRAIGYGHEVDAFVLAMNRAAERAAPQAKPIFKQALKEMTFADAKQILRGGDTAATEFFRAKTAERLTAAFQPVVSSSLNEVGATKSYKDLVARYASNPFMSRPALDLDRHVTDKALAGLFHMLGEEERKIRKDPAARVTKLLKEVFADKKR